MDRSVRANGFGIERIDSVSAISVRGLWLNKFSLEARLGNKTLSSLAFPSIEFGSSCSFNILKRADRPGMSRLVRKSLVAGSAAARLNSGFGSGMFLFFLLRLRDIFEVLLWPSLLKGSTFSLSLALRLFLKTCIMPSKLS